MVKNAHNLRKTKANSGESNLWHRTAFDNNVSLNQQGKAMCKNSYSFQKSTFSYWWKNMPKDVSFVW